MRRPVNKQRIFRIICLYRYVQEETLVVPADFCQLFGITERTFRRDVEILNAAMLNKKLKGGRYGDYSFQ